MLEQHPFVPYAPDRHPSRDSARAAWAQHPPRHNRLLAALPRADYERLLPEMEPVPLPLGWTVHRAGDRDKYLYFLTAGIISRSYATANGASAAFAVTGSEGVIGVASFLGGESTPSQAVVLSAGYSYRLKADLLKAEFEHDGALPHLLLRYTQALITQTGQVAACNRHHSLEQQLCRWFLSCLDRLPSNELTMTHQLIAGMLGVRRVGVTGAARMLQEAGLIHYHRGHITVLDRRRLEARACECYAIVKGEYDRLLRLEYPACNAGVPGTDRRYRTGCEGPAHTEST
jgi:CRP-like cAMP-binding protein